jgi:hypothetical protein
VRNDSARGENGSSGRARADEPRRLAATPAYLLVFFTPGRVRFRSRAARSADERRDRGGPATLPDGVVVSRRVVYETAANWRTAAIVILEETPARVDFRQGETMAGHG